MTYLISKIQNSKWWIQNGGRLAKIFGKNTKNGKIAILGSKIYELCMK